MLSTQLRSITDLRLNPLLISRLASDEGPVYILNRNKPVSVMIDVEEYEELLNQFQDAKDAAEIKKWKKTAKPSDFISHQKLMKELKLEN